MNDKQVYGFALGKTVRLGGGVVIGKLAYIGSIYGR